MATKFKSKFVFGKTGVFDSIGVGVQDPDGNLHISGRDLRLTSGSAHFDNRPLVNGSPVMLSGDTVSIDVSDLYPASNPSGFITGVSNLVHTTGNQTISGIKNFTERPTLNGTGFLLIGEVEGGGGGATTINDLDKMFNSARATYYHELSYAVNGDVSAIEVYTDSAKGTRLYSRTFAYDENGNLAQIETTDRQNIGASLTKTLSYDGSDNLISTTRIYT